MRSNRLICPSLVLEQPIFMHSVVLEASWFNKQIKTLRTPLATDDLDRAIDIFQLLSFDSDLESVPTISTLPAPSLSVVVVVVSAPLPSNIDSTVMSLQHGQCLLPFGGLDTRILTATRRWVGTTRTEGAVRQQRSRR